MAETRMEVDSMDPALAVFGSCDENIRLLEQALGVTVVCRGTELKFSGPEELAWGMALDAETKWFGTIYFCAQNPISPPL